MLPLAELGRRPPRITSDSQFAAWFATLAEHLLNHTEFLVAAEAYRFAELEAYYYGPGHPDPFAHRNPIQRNSGLWYFHRTGSAYRGGSFKGVDLTLGDGTATFGILVRTIIAPDGTMIDGPSRTVDHLLARTGAATVAKLDALMAGRTAWNASSPLAVRETHLPRNATVYPTARVGLSLKRIHGKPDAPKYLMKPYRYLTEPRRISKGKPQLVLAFHQDGRDPEAIRALTGVPMHAIERYVAAFEAGKQHPDFAQFFGKDLDSVSVCRLLGSWAAEYAM